MLENKEKKQWKNEKSPEPTRCVQSSCADLATAVWCSGTVNTRFLTLLCANARLVRGRVSGGVSGLTSKWLSCWLNAAGLGEKMGECSPQSNRVTQAF